MYFLSIFSLFLATLPFNLAYADSCSELRNGVFGIEYLLKTTQLPNCKDVDKTKVRCCDKGRDLDSCKTLNQAELDYNTALAKVNMIESLIAISHAVDSNHNALRKLDSAQLDSAEKLVDDFLNNFSKANVLDKSFKFIDKKTLKNGKNIWVDYKGKTTQELNTYLTEKCTDEDYKDFCEEYKNVVDEGKVSDEDLLNTLNNFAQADNKINYDLGRRLENYKEYSKFFKVNITTQDKPIGLDEVMTTKEIEKIIELKKQIQIYKTSNSKESAQKILTISKSLQKIDMNFSKDMNVRSSLADSTKKEFEKDLVNISSVAGTMLNRDLVKNNLAGTGKSLELEIKNKESIFLKDVKSEMDIFNSCEEKPTTGKQAITCIQKLCNSKTPACLPDDNNQILLSGNLQELYDKAKRLKDAETLKIGNEAMLSCMELKEPSKQFSCLKLNKDKLGNLISDGLQDAKDELKNSSKTLDYIKGAKPIKRLRFKKYMGLNALEQNECISDNDKENSTAIKSYCDTPALDGHILSAVNLSNGVNDIMVTFDQDRLKNDAKAIYGNDSENFDKYHSQLKDDCASDKKHTIALCKYYEGEADDIELRKQEVITKGKKDKKRRENSLAKARAWHKKYEIKKQTSNRNQAAQIAGILGQTIQGGFGIAMQQRSWNTQKLQYQNMYNYQSYMFSEDTVHDNRTYIWNFDQMNPTGFDSIGTNYLDTGAINFDYDPIPFSYSLNGGSTYVAPVSSSTATGTSTGTYFNFAN
jgi:hypothetical protein